MASLGEGPVIAVDVKASLERPPSAAPQSFSAMNGGKPERAGDNGVGVDGARVLRTPSIGETLARVLLLGSANTSEAASRHASLVIRPRPEGVGLLEFHQLDAARQAGRTAALQALEEGPAIALA
jgi:predicted acylesterase/phospholipase RssA